MSGLSVASTVLVLFYHHRNKNIGIKYPDRTPDVHSTRLYRVKRPEKENNNRHNGLIQLMRQTDHSLTRVSSGIQLEKEKQY
jgi:hypothetical protein